MAEAAKDWSNVALRTPFAQWFSNLFTKADSATAPCAFSKALLSLALGALPDSYSSCHPLSLFAPFLQAWAEAEKKLQKH